MVARQRTIVCMGCGERYEDAQVFEKSGGEIKQVGISMMAFCKCGYSFTAADLLEASQKRRKRER